MQKNIIASFSFLSFTLLIVRCIGKFPTPRMPTHAHAPGSELERDERLGSLGKFRCVEVRAQAHALSATKRLIVAPHFAAPSRQGAAAEGFSDLSDLWEQLECCSSAHPSAAERNIPRKACPPHTYENQLTVGFWTCY